MTARPVVTLLTDFGLRDPYVGALKARLIESCPSVRLVDLTHGVPPQDVRGAAFVLGTNWALFPIGTTHLTVVDPGVGSPRLPIAVRSGGHRFVGPDNGVFDAVLDATEEAVAPDARRVVGPERAAVVSATFHGRDLFAPAAAKLALGAALPELGRPVDPSRLHRLDLAHRREDGRVFATVVWIDRFGNLITTLRAEHLGGLDPARCRVEIGGRSVQGLSRTYADVSPGDALAYWGSAGTLELALRDGNLAAEWTVRAGDELKVSAG